MKVGFAQVAAGGVTSAVVVVLLTGTGVGWARAEIVAPTPAWMGFAANAQHTGVAPTSPQPLDSIHWHHKVDFHPGHLSEGAGPISHYASPMITSSNTVVVPTRLGTKRGFELRAYDGADGTEKWRISTDFTVPIGAADQFPPPIPASLIDDSRVAVAAAGGTVLIRSQVDDASGPVRRIAFYGIDNWRANRAAFNQAVQITTPLTAGPDGSLYFGFSAARHAPGHLHNGIARIDPAGQGSWISARALGGFAADTRVTLSCAPALSNDGSTGYVSVISGANMALIGFDSTTLRPTYRHELIDPQTHRPAAIIESSSATPTVGPDGDVYYGIEGNPLRRHDIRGWLLHFNKTLTKVKTPGSFGWDQTVSVMPASSVPSYTGDSAYLLVSKYNNYYVGPHGDGRNEIALLDPHASQPDRFSTVNVMTEVRTALSPLHPPHTPQGNRYEWCINSVAVDPTTGSAIANNEDGRLYRWDLDTGKLVEHIQLGAARGQAYTETVVGPDGTSYAIANAILYAVGGLAP